MHWFAAMWLTNEMNTEISVLHPEQVYLIKWPVNVYKQLYQFQFIVIFKKDCKRRKEEEEEKKRVQWKYLKLCGYETGVSLLHSEFQ